MKLTPDPARLHRPAALSVAALWLGLLAFAAPALAAPGWLAPANLSETGQNALLPQVAMDPTGDAVSVWARAGVIQAAVKPTFGEVWSAPENLSEAGQEASVPQVAIDAAGDAVAVWLRSDGANKIVQTASRPVGGPWSAPEDLSEAGQDAAVPQVASNAAGDTVVVWSRSDGTNKVIQATSRSAGGSWSAPETLSETGQDAANPKVAIDPAGDAVAVWERSNGANSIIQSASRPAGGSWSTPADLSEPGQNANSGQVAVDPAGEAVAIWNRVSGTGAIIQSSAAPAGGSWSTPTDISEAGPSTGAFAVVLDAGGEAVAAWRRSSGGKTVIQAASRAAGSPWSIPTTLSDVSQNSNQPRVAVDPAGDAFAVWARAGALGIQAATRPAGGSWSTPVDLSAAGVGASAPGVAVDSAGDVVSVWVRSNGTNVIAQATGFATGPHPLSSSIPAAGTAGETLPFSATWWDAWSPLGQVAWDFGDGATAEGGAVGHAYASPGTYQVGATATDLRGESSAIGGEVTIAAAPVPPPPSGGSGNGQAGNGTGGQGAGAGQGGSQSGGPTAPVGSHRKHHKSPPKKKVKKKAELSVSLTPSTSLARPTSVLTYRITVANPGGSAARAVKVCGRLPSGQSALRAEPRADGGSAPCWRLGTLDAGARRTLRLSVQVGALSAAGTEVARAVASAANVAGAHADTATVRIRPLPATACGSSLSGSAIGRLAMRC